MNSMEKHQRPHPCVANPLWQTLVDDLSSFDDFSSHRDRPKWMVCYYQCLISDGCKPCLVDSEVRHGQQLGGMNSSTIVSLLTISINGGTTLNTKTIYQGNNQFRTTFGIIYLAKETTSFECTPFVATLNRKVLKATLQKISQSTMVL